MSQTGTGRPEPDTTGPASPTDTPRLSAYLPPALTLVAILAAAVAQLRFQGRRWWCACGRPDLWWGDTRSVHNSQHLFDPYSFTHILHGVVFYGILSWVAPRLSLVALCAAVALAATWEVIENTDFVIHRYRTVTASLGYQGDTVANSLGDILCCAVGFLLARRLGLWGLLALFLVTEATLLLWIKDSLTLELLMLIHPIESIKEWQMGQSRWPRLGKSLQSAVRGGNLSHWSRGDLSGILPGE